MKRNSSLGSEVLIQIELADLDKGMKDINLESCGLGAKYNTKYILL